MNRIFRVLFNRAKGMYVVCGETAENRGRNLLRAVAVVVLGMGTVVCQAETYISPQQNLSVTTEDNIVSDIESGGYAFRANGSSGTSKISTSGSMTLNLGKNNMYDGTMYGLYSSNAGRLNASAVSLSVSGKSLDHEYENSSSGKTVRAVSVGVFATGNSSVVSVDASDVRINTSSHGVRASTGGAVYLGYRFDNSTGQYESVSLKNLTVNAGSDNSGMGLYAGNGKIAVNAGSSELSGYYGINAVGTGAIDLKSQTLAIDSTSYSVAAMGDKSNTENMSSVSLAADSMTFQQGVMARYASNVTLDVREKLEIGLGEGSQTSRALYAYESGIIHVKGDEATSVSLNAQDGAISVVSGGKVLLGEENGRLGKVSVVPREEKAVYASGGQVEVWAHDAEFTSVTDNGSETNKGVIAAFKAVGGATIDIHTDNRLVINGDVGFWDNTENTSGTININQDDADGGVVQIQGDVITRNTEGHVSTVNISLSGEDSFISGAIIEAGDTANENGGVSLDLSDGATWNVSEARVNARDENGQIVIQDGAPVRETTVHSVKSINSENAIINNRNGEKIEIEELKTAEGSNTTYNTESVTENQLQIGNKQGALTVVLDDSAGQLGGNSPEETARQIADIVQINNGDKSAIFSKKEDSLLGKMEIRTDAEGNIISVSEAKNTVTDSLQKIGAMNFLTFRAQTNDVSKRMGDLRSMPQADGMWARAIAGQSEYKSIHNTYQTLQIGADKRIGNIYVGGTASYTDGEGKLDNGSTDDKNWSFGLYGGWIADDGQYVDIIIKRHKLDTDFDLHTQSGTGVNGRYHTWGTSASVEYGWRLGIADTDYYIEPQAELMIGHLNGVSHTTNVGTNIKQEGIDTAVGRVGIAAGWISPEKTGSAYLKASVLHDWEGDAKTRVSNKKAMRSYTEDMGGTWGEFALGGTWNINKSLAAYGEVETTAGNPVRTTYQVSGGIRYSF